MPKPVPVVPTPVELARSLRRLAHPKAQQVINDLLDHPTAHVRMEAAKDVLDRSEGRARTTVTVEGPSEEEREQKASFAAFFTHVRETTPELLGQVVDWLRLLAAGTPATVPTGLQTPADGPARDLFDRATAASEIVEALP
jgi:hypothetical protein